MRGLWARLSVTYWLDPKVMGLSVEAELLYVRSIAYARGQETNGVIPRGALGTLGVKLRNPEGAAKELVARKLWIRNAKSNAARNAQRIPEGWSIPLRVWESWQGKGHPEERERAGNAARQARWRAKKSNALLGRDGNALRNGQELEGELKDPGDYRSQPSYSNGAPGSDGLESERMDPAAAAAALRGTNGPDRNRPNT